MDKDQVLEEVQDLRDRIARAIERVTTGQAPMRIPAEISDVDLVLADCLPALAELESLRAMRKRVEGKVSEWREKAAEFDTDDLVGLTANLKPNDCAEELRSAFGDSHE